MRQNNNTLDNESQNGIAVMFKLIMANHDKEDLIC